MGSAPSAGEVRELTPAHIALDEFATALDQLVKVVEDGALTSFDDVEIRRRLAARQ